MRFPTMWYVRPSKSQTSLHICAVWSDRAFASRLKNLWLLSYDRTSFGVSKLKGGCTGSPESMHVKMPHCWKSHVPALKRTDSLSTHSIWFGWESSSVPVGRNTGGVNQLFRCLFNFNTVAALYSLNFRWSFMICIVVLWLTYLKFLYPWNLWEVCKCGHILFTSCFMHMLCKLISVCFVWTRVILNTARRTSYPKVVTSVLTHLSKFTPSFYQSYMQRQFHGKNH